MRGKDRRDSMAALKRDFFPGIVFGRDKGLQSAEEMVDKRDWFAGLVETSHKLLKRARCLWSSASHTMLSNAPCEKQPVCYTSLLPSSAGGSRFRYGRSADPL